MKDEQAKTILPIEILPWPRGKKCPVIIRDDDVSFFTSKKMLSSIYAYAWEKKYKIDFGVVPFISGNAAARPRMRRNPRLAHLLFEPCIPTYARGTPCKYDIRENEELVAYLSSLRYEGKIDLTLHGYSHDRKDFLTNDSEKIEILLKSATENFSSAFDYRPKTFVFPYYECSQEALAASSKLGFNFFFDSPSSLFSRILKRLGFLKTARILNNESIVLFPNNKFSVCSPIFSGFTPEESFENCKKLFMNSLRRKHAFWIVHHFWEFFFDWQETLSQKDFLQTFNKMLDFMDQHNVWKCSTAELAEWILSLRKVQIKKNSPNKVVLKSVKLPKGLTVKIKGQLQEKEKNSSYLEQLDENTYVVSYLPEDKEIQIQCS